MCDLFNVKIIRYANGTVEVRQYDRVINNHLMYITEEDLLNRQRVGIENAKDDICQPDLVYNPFSEKEEEIIEFSQMEILAKRAERSAKNSLNRTVNEVYKYSRQCNWDYFVTLTFDKKKVDRYDFSECMKKASKWFNNQQQRKAFNLQYIFVPEQHEDGAWHVHGLIARVGDMSFIDSGRKAKGRVVYNLTGWKFGFSTATKVVDTCKVSSYITKYITKELCAVTKGKKRYYRSRNIPEPVEDNFLLENEERDNYIAMVMDSMGADEEYTKSITGYVNVDYKYYKVKE